MPASIDPTSRRILLHIGAHYGAITMPTDLGERVQRTLGRERGAPVVAHPRAERWTFLTGPGQPDAIGAAVAAELFRLYATVATVGSQVVLPSPEDERTGYRTWIRRPPRDASALPALEDVIEATRALGDDRASRSAR